MAGYLNTNETAKNVPRIGRIEAGAVGYPVPNQYLPPEWLAEFGLEKVSESPSPWTIFKSDSPSATFENLEMFKTIAVMNDSSAMIFCAPNGHTGDAVGLPVFKNTIYPITQEREITKLVITGAGTGAVYLICVRGD